MKSETEPFIRYSSFEYKQVLSAGLTNRLLTERRPRVLLHACCGSCATSCIERLVKDYSVTVFYYNPNITDEEEYFKRRDALLKFISEFNKDYPDNPVSYIEGEYEPDVFIKRAEKLRDEPEGGKRCSVCFDIRLAEAARVAKSIEADCYTTSLTVSPHKNFEDITARGKVFAEGCGIEYLAIDFKKQNGFGRSVELCKKYGIYRQNFCGCDYSRNKK